MSMTPKLRAAPKRVSLVNQKGGAGKSTSALFIACAAVELGARVLIRDMDPQANSTIALSPSDVEYTINDVLRPDEQTGEVVEGSLGSAIRPAGPQWPKGLYVVPATLAQAERESDQAIGREYRLRIASHGALDAFDLVINDCPPSVGQLTVNALTDSDEAWIVSTPELWSVQGAYQAARTINRVRTFFNGALALTGVLVNSFKTAGVGAGRLESRLRLQELQAAFESFLLPEVINDVEVLRKAVGAMSPLSTFGNEAEQVRKQYRVLAERLLHS
jgi:chromosome partitioning protein